MELLESQPQPTASSLARLVPSWPEPVMGVGASVGAAVVGIDETSVSVVIFFFSSLNGLRAVDGAAEGDGLGWLRTL